MRNEETRKERRNDEVNLIRSVLRGCGWTDRQISGIGGLRAIKRIGRKQAELRRRAAAKAAR
jgi:hypothetical protein